MVSSGAFGVECIKHGSAHINAGLIMIVGVDLVCKPGDAYPCSVPKELSLRETKGLSRNQLDDLTALAVETAERNVGMASGFVVRTCQLTSPLLHLQPDICIITSL